MSNNENPANAVHTFPEGIPTKAPDMPRFSEVLTAIEQDRHTSAEGKIYKVVALQATMMILLLDRIEAIREQLDWPPAVVPKIPGNTLRTKEEIAALREAFGEKFTHPEDMENVGKEPDMAPTAQELTEHKAMLQATVKAILIKTPTALLSREMQQVADELKAEGWKPVIPPQPPLKRK